MPVVEVQLITAEWCKRCHQIKPDVVATCAMTGASLGIVDYDELADDDPLKDAVEALPTIRMRTDPTAAWVSYVPANIEKWKEDIIALFDPVAMDVEF
jgi:hypothetical protein